jgi:acyl-CoA synthetase (AMP-forming)/AMP-acid ligase II
MPNSETYIIDENGQKVTMPGIVGELAVRGANVMKGYWNLPSETDRVLKPGLYRGEYVLHTGDLFKMDEEGYLYFIARKDDIIKTAGERVSPREVENAIYELDEVAEVAVIGVDDPMLGQAVKAMVALKEGATLDDKAVMRHCATLLEPFKVPRIVEFHKELPKTMTGKIQKKAFTSDTVSAKEPAVV